MYFVLGVSSQQEDVDMLTTTGVIPFLQLPECVCWGGGSLQNAMVWVPFPAMYCNQT